MLTPENLVREPVVAIVVTKVEANLGVLVLDVEDKPNPARLRAHGFHLSRRVVAREHAAVIVAGVVHEAARFFTVWPGVAVCVAVGGGPLDSEGEQACEGGKE